MPLTPLRTLSPDGVRWLADWQTSSISTAGGGEGFGDTISIDPKIYGKPRASLLPSTHSHPPYPPMHAAGEAPEEPRMPASHPSVRAPTCVCVHVWWLYRVVRDANRSLAPGGVAWHAGSHS